jgi:hypothetical protein
MGCGCKKKSTNQVPQKPVVTNDELKNQIKVVINKYNKIKK